MKNLTVRQLPFVGAAIILATSASMLFANAYSVSGISLYNFSVFTEDSVANSADLTQGPKQNGTGNQVDSPDLLLGGISGGGGGPSQSVELDDSSSSSSGLYEKRCVGACGFVEDDFAPTPMAPTNPTGLGAYARTDVRQSGNFFSTIAPGYQSATVAETEIVRAPTRGSAGSRARYTRGRYFTPAFTDELVIDFNVVVFQRTLSDIVATGTYMTSSTNLVISIRALNGEPPIFVFSPDGEAGGSIGAIEISDPVSVNASLISLPAPAGEDNQNFGSKQYRAITPTLLRGVAYGLNISQTAEIRAAVVPEPASLLMTAGAASFLIGYRKKR